MPAPSRTTTCPLCLSPALRVYSARKAGAHAGYAKCRLCRSSLFFGDAGDPTVTAKGAARLGGLITGMGTWFRKSGLTPSAARAELLDRARESAGVLASGLEGQVGKCPACDREEAVLCYLDKRSRIRIYCTACTMGLYAGTDLALPGIVTAFEDLAPLVLRLKTPVLVGTDPPGSSAVSASGTDAQKVGGGAHG